LLRVEESAASFIRASHDSSLNNYYNFDVAFESSHPHKEGKKNGLICKDYGF